MLPPKVNNFLCCACRNCLHTRIRLQSRGVLYPTLCVCSDHDKDIYHLFFACTKSVACWQHTGLWSSVLPSLDPSTDFSLNVFAVLQHLDGHEK